VATHTSSGLVFQVVGAGLAGRKNPSAVDEFHFVAANEVLISVFDFAALDALFVEPRSIR
jgi:hypothetical protein